jgi:hypothetical protein
MWQGVDARISWTVDRLASALRPLTFQHRISKFSLAIKEHEEHAGNGKKPPA